MKLARRVRHGCVVALLMLGGALASLAQQGTSREMKTDVAAEQQAGAPDTGHAGGASPYVQLVGTVPAALRPHRGARRFWYSAAGSAAGRTAPMLLSASGSMLSSKASDPRPTGASRRASRLPSLRGSISSARHSR